MVAPMRRRFAYPFLIAAFKISQRRACELLKVNRKTLNRKSVKTDVPALRARIKDIAATRVRYGYPRIHILLRREGWIVNRKRVYRIYREEGLSMRLKPPRRRKSAAVRSARPVADVVNHTWSMDFMADNLADGRKIRLLTIVDNFSRECLALDVDRGFKGTDVAQVLTRIVSERGKPRQIRCDNGPEFISKALDQWACWNKVELDFSRPGKPTDNAFIESFNGRVRQELLNASWFETLDQAREMTSAWRAEYNEHRPHRSLGNTSPKEFARAHAMTVSQAGNF
jgi:putative transposase